jgi:hypothetical protein
MIGHFALKSQLGKMLKMSVKLKFVGNSQRMRRDGFLGAALSDILKGKCTRLIQIEILFKNSYLYLK